jgi:integrase
VAYAFPRKGKDEKTRYTAVYKDITGKARSAGTFDTHKRALREAIEAEADVHAGRAGDPQRAKTTLGAYVTGQWLAHHVIERTTREGYTYLLNRYLLPELGDLRIRDLDPETVRAWVSRLSNVHGANPPTIRAVKVLFDAIMTTLVNDRVIHHHPGRGVKIPTVAVKPLRIIDLTQYERFHTCLPEGTMRLLVETAIETGLRWGELSELRPADLDYSTGMLTVSRVVIQLHAASDSQGPRFEVKHYPKDKEWRRVKLAAHLVTKIRDHVLAGELGPNDLLFPLPQPEGPARRHRPAELPDPLTLGLTEPNSAGRTYHHGTLTAYQAGKCRCQHCKDAVAAYRAARRSAGKDNPCKPRTTRTDTDRHMPNAWFRRNVWNPALATAELGFRITPHSLRHAHASWLLAGGADLQVVKERLGHASITTTEKYLHTLPDHHDAALAALDNIRAPRTAGEPPSTPRPPAQAPDHTAAPEQPTQLQSPTAAAVVGTAADPQALLAALGPDVVRQVLTGLLLQQVQPPTSTAS